MIPYINKIIAHNLLKESIDGELARQKTLLPEEQCQLCGRELSHLSRQGAYLCGACVRKTAKRSYCISDVTWRLDKGHGESFRRAWDIAFGLERI